jgi:hypothetical protein
MALHHLFVTFAACNSAPAALRQVADGMLLALFEDSSVALVSAGAVQPFHAMHALRPPFYE